MTTMSRAAMLPTLLSEADAILAKDAGHVLATHFRESDPLELRTSDDVSPGGTVKLPASAVRLLIGILEEMARGNAVTLIPVHPELTTQEAAQILNISRPSLIQLLNEGQIYYRRVGTHRRVQFESLIQYKRDAEAARLRFVEPPLRNPAL